MHFQSTKLHGVKPTAEPASRMRDEAFMEDGLREK
jgi:hypothetical protein